ncbi:MAG: hypothetical protein ACKO54_18475, partial [Alphaproteobacteria bacterium]
LREVLPSIATTSGSPSRRASTQAVKQDLKSSASSIPRQSGCDERVNQDEKTRLDFGMIVAISDFCNA